MYIRPSVINFMGGGGGGKKPSPLPLDALPPEALPPVPPNHVLPPEALPPVPPDPEPAILTTFTGNNFTGEVIQCSTEFADSLQDIDTYAGNHNVQIVVTHSLRELDQELSDKVHEAVGNSNHLAGHAIDMNIRYEGELYNSEKLHPDNFDSLPKNVQDFLNNIRNDKDLRWGGDFENPDPVHIDDGLFQRDPDTYIKMRDEIQKAFQNRILDYSTNDQK